MPRRFATVAPEESGKVVSTVSCWFDRDEGRGCVRWALVVVRSPREQVAELVPRSLLLLLFLLLLFLRCARFLLVVLVVLVFTLLLGLLPAAVALVLAALVSLGAMYTLLVSWIVCKKSSMHQFVGSGRWVRVK
jgi:hypothetical protein